MSALKRNQVVDFITRSKSSWLQAKVDRDLHLSMIGRVCGAGIKDELNVDDISNNNVFRNVSSLQLHSSSSTQPPIVSIVVNDKIFRDLAKAQLLAAPL